MMVSPALPTAKLCIGRERSRITGEAIHSLAGLQAAIATGCAGSKDDEDGISGSIEGELMAGSDKMDGVMAGGLIS